MLRQIIFTLLVVTFITSPRFVFAERVSANPFEVVIEKPFIDLRTGPATAYPAFYVAQRGQALTILKRRTHWLKVRLEDSNHRRIVGWVHKDELYQARVAGSTLLAREHPALRYNYEPRFSGNYALGRLEGSDLISLQFAYHGSKVLSTELNAGFYTGTTNQGWLADARLVYEPFYRFKLSPFVNLGYGYIKREQSGTLIVQEDDSDTYLNAGLGLKLRFHELYQIRFEYQVNNTLTETNDNRELELWQIGLSTYF